MGLRTAAIRRAALGVPPPPEPVAPRAIPARVPWVPVPAPAGRLPLAHQAALFRLPPPLTRRLSAASRPHPVALSPSSRTRDIAPASPPAPCSKVCNRRRIETLCPALVPPDRTLPSPLPAAAAVPAVQVEARAAARAVLVAAAARPPQHRTAREQRVSDHTEDTSPASPGDASSEEACRTHR